MNREASGIWPGVPGPPTDMLMPQMIQSVIIWASCAMIAVAVTWGIIKLLRERDMLPLTLLFGGLLVFLAVEPFYDVLGFVYHPEIGQVVAFNTLGRNFPLHLLLLYVVYWGMLAYYFDRKFQAGVSDKWVWLAFLLWTPGEIIFETPLLMLGLWSYYGDPPFMIGYYPLWLAPATAGSAILAFSVVHCVRKIIPVAMTPVLSLVMSSACAAGCLATSWPIFLALNVDRNLTPSGFVLTVPATLLTIALSAGCTWLALQVLKVARAIDDQNAVRAR